MMGKPDLSDYIEVSTRIKHFREVHPEGTLQSEIVSMTESLVVVKAYAYRTPDDPRPGVGLASEPIPGKTTFTRDSEVMNCETSAWGRAIIAVGASDASRVASADEVRNRQPEVEGDPQPVLDPMTDDQEEVINVLLQTAAQAGVELDEAAVWKHARQSEEHASAAIGGIESRIEEIRR